MLSMGVIASVTGYPICVRDQRLCTAHRAKNGLTRELIFCTLLDGKLLRLVVVAIWLVVAESVALCAGPLVRWRSVGDYS